MSKNNELIKIKMIKKTNEIKHIPYVHALLETDPRRLALFCGLSWRYEPKNEQLMCDQIEEWISTIGAGHFVPLNRLLWCYRIEGGKKSFEFADGHSKETRLHAHVVIWKERIVEDSHKIYTREEAADFLRARWKHGIADVRKYDGRTKKGIKYMLKARLGVESADYVDCCRMSNELFKRLKRMDRQSIAT